ncbi:MFS transporter [Brevundimonas aveniformis]|uniref:MFS transporter n=1 Tax=Brevundimonas aveniformis TaxID=370977 RepID=UPI000411D9D9|nr:MFS transporter [Brevundimonas aveniformis]
MTAFHQILGNNLVANITNFTVWFALTFWVFLQTQSVFATGMIAGLYLVLIAGTAIWFGSVVDHHRKKRVMLASSAISFCFYGAALGLVAMTPAERFQDVAGFQVWALIGLTMFGVLAGNLRSISLPTLVTLLVPEDRRDRANGLVGMVSGFGFLTTSVISGLLVAWGGMTATLILAMGLSALVFLHLTSVRLDEPEPEAGLDEAPRQVDLRGTIAIIAGVPGLFALIFFSTFNNLLGGVFMALMDAYGLSMMEVQQWGLLWGGVSVAFIASGLVIARAGLGRNPLRTLMIVNLIAWAGAAVFTIQPSIWLLAGGAALWMFLGPYGEAAEQTTLQKVVPYERQGRVFGFAQSVEQAASPMTAFLIGPITQFWVIPFMSQGGLGAELIGDWFGTGPARGIALVFCISGLAGVVLTILAFNSGYYRRLSAVYLEAPEPETETQAP